MLDAASLFQLFANLSGPDLARCACVNHSWRTVAYSEPLWHHLCRQLETEQLHRDDILAELGSYREYYKWRHPRTHRRVNRICVLDNSGSGQTKVVLGEVFRTTGPGTGYVPRNVSAITQPCSYIGGSANKPTWSPVGALLAYSSLQPRRFSVVVVNHQGQQVSELLLEGPPLPPIYLHWAPCGTRLLMLSAWPSGQVSLLAWDVGPALLPGAGRARRAKKPVLLGTARPLFLTCCPTSTRVLWHGNMQHFALVDCATTVDEDGSEHDRVFSNMLPGGARVPQWIRDSQGREWLLLSVVLEGGEQAAGVGAAEAAAAAAAGAAGEEEERGELLLLPVDAMEEAYEMGGSMLSLDLVRSISTRVCQITDIHNPAFTANRGGSIVAFTESHQAAVRFMGAAERVFRLELPARHPGVPVLAMEWSPDGRKLLLLTLDGSDWSWVVWHAPQAAPPDDVSAADLAGQLGCLMLCQTHQPSAAFQSEYLPFFDQFAQSLQLWSPDSDAFCYTAVDAPTRPSLRDIGRESSYVYVQPVPGPDQLQVLADAAPSSSSTDGGSSSSSRRSGGRKRLRRPAQFMEEQGEAVGLQVFDGPAPSRIMPGSIASWSFT